MSQPEISESIKVFIRQRPDGVGLQSSPADEPTSNKDKSSGVTDVSSDGKTCTYYSAANKMQQKFAVDRYFLPDTQQAELFDTIALPIVDSALLGYSGTIMAYGPTSSGKTHTMRGGMDKERGIMPRCIERLLAQQTQSDCEIWASYLQIYCETITDLLWQPNNKDNTAEGGNTITAYSANQPLLLRDKATTSTGSSSSATAGVYVEGLSRYKIQSVDDLWELLQRGDMNRSTAATNMNETSSRSHAVLMVKIVTKDDDINTADTATTGYRESTLMLVDLAGSERAAASEGKSSLRLEEAKAINLSLSALGNCMNALATASEGKVTHVPYRDSKLTRLLQGCLGGGARTAVVVTLAPGTDTAGESLSALRFASRASKVSVKAQVNRYKDYEALYREMKFKLQEFQSGAANTVDSAQQQRGLSDLQQSLKQRDSTISEQAVEISLLKQQLAALQSNSGGPGGSSVRAVGSSELSSSAVASVTTTNTANMSAAEVEAHWAAKLDSAAKQHVIALEAAHRSFQATLRQAQQGEQQALRELGAKQEDIKAERERNLSTMRTLRENQDKRMEEENLHKARVTELLSELAALRDHSDDLQSQNDTLVAELKASLERVKELESALFNSVSKAQVKEMESLFIETVTRLSERVNMLEGKRASDEGSTISSGVNSGNTGSARMSVSSNINSSASAREVRIEPGGRIRASNSGSTKLPDGTNSNSNKYTSMNASASNCNISAGNSGVGVISGGVAGGMQHSQSASVVAPASTVSGKTAETKGKLW